MSAQLISLRCQNCGSSLQVGDGLRFVTCAYCKCELAIKRDESTIHTEVLEAIHANTETTVTHLQVIELQNEIERLDREWEKWRERNLSRGENGVVIEPGEPIPKQWIVLSAIIVILIGMVLGWSRHSWALPLLGVVLSSMIILSGFAREFEARHFFQTRILYENKRTVLCHQLDTARARRVNDAAA